MRCNIQAMDIAFSSVAFFIMLCMLEIKRLHRFLLFLSSVYCALLYVAFGSLVGAGEENSKMLNGALLKFASKLQNPECNILHENFALFSLIALPREANILKALSCRSETFNMWQLYKMHFAPRDTLDTTTAAALTLDMYI